MISRFIFITLLAHLSTTVTAYRTWGIPNCQSECHLEADDCLKAAGQFPFATDKVYTSPKDHSSESHTFGTCSVTLEVQFKGCRISSDHLMKPNPVEGDNVKQKHGGLAYLLDTCATVEKKCGRTLLRSDPNQIQPTSAKVCEWEVSFTEVKI